MIKNLFNFGKTDKSFFFKLFMSFMAIITLLVSFNFLSYTFFRNNIQSQIISHSGLNLNTSVNNLETYFRLIKNMGFNLYFNKDAEILQNASSVTNYEIVSQLYKELQISVANPFLHLDNLILFYRDKNLIIEKGGSSKSEDMFAKYYNSSYDLNFWIKEMDKPNSFKAYPAAPFREKGLQEDINKGLLMPILIKNKYSVNFSVIALLDIQGMYNTFRESRSEDRFFIMDENQNLLFSSANETKLEGIELPPHNKMGYVKRGSNYYFYQKGTDSGFWYIRIIPNELITSQIVKLNLILLLFLALAIGISIAVSVYFSRKFNNPLNQLIQSIQQWNTPQSARNNIKEFVWISDKVSDLIKTNQDFHKDLTDKNSLLSNYTYINKLKMIHMTTSQDKLPFDINKPFRLVLFQLNFKPGWNDMLDIGQDKGAYVIKEYIQLLFSNEDSDSITLQIEQDQILAVIFKETQNPLALMETLKRMKQVFDLDKKFWLVTISVSLMNDNSSDFATAYVQILDMQKQRKLVNETQIIDEILPAAHSQLFNTTEEQEFIINLQSGHETILQQLVKRVLLQMNKKESPALHYAEFAADIINKVRKVFLSLQLDFETLWTSEISIDPSKECYTPEDYSSFYELFLQRAAAQIRDKKQETDPITEFVIRHFENHYSEDISLDLIADKLNITGAYLSTYFKEKKGINFSDCLNEVRMNKAKELLQKTDMKIQDVAAHVGYHNVNSFNRMFKKVTGVPPGEFRKEIERG